MLYYYLFILVVCATCITKSTNGWDIPSNNQYHIQTDEGPERYFRYQTDSGQYRKEKRLEDGTVVGTYAWIDDNGVLRQRDYIADTAGYRILKTKNIYVGRNVPVWKAIKTAKKYSANTDILENYKRKPIEAIHLDTPSNVYGLNTVQHTTSSPISSTTANPYEDIFSNNILSTTPVGVGLSSIAPIVDIRPKSIYSTSKYPLPLLPNNSTPIRYDNTNYVSTTSSTVDYAKKLHYESTPRTLTGYQYLPSTRTIYEPLSPSYIDYNNEASKERNQNGLDYNPYVSHLNRNYRFQNGPTYPLDQNGKVYDGHNVENDYNNEYQTYDGASITNDGFRYYIPRAYHEEQTLPGDKRSGSFGYIDPFGIRRVIYYNTSPGTGFQHKKNNRYVGFQATPYDPRPY